MVNDGQLPALTFIGGAGTVTGSKTLLEIGERRILIDCGLFQGRKKLRLQNWDSFPIEPSSIDAVLLTHAHIDHCGYLPRLVRLGFDGPVYCTQGTKDLAGIVLPDSGYLQEEEADYANRRGYSKHQPALPLYTKEEAIASLEHLVAVDFDMPVAIAPELSATWHHAGHILGAASIHLHLLEQDQHVVFSGDLGRSNHPLLVPPAPIGEADVVVVESTYGDENHPEYSASDVMASAINEATKRGGVVVIPAFAVDRTEVVLWHLNELVAAGRVPGLPVFVDSPMALRALDVYRDAARRSSSEIRPALRKSELFPALELHAVSTVDQSKQLVSRRGPMIVISASGMATGGRVIHHLANRISNDRNVVMLVGFQAPGTRGARLKQGERQIKLFGSYRPVQADVVSVELSTHADQDDLVEWIGTASPTLGAVYVNHGETAGSTGLIDALAERSGIFGVIPRPGERVLIEPRGRPNGSDDDGDQVLQHPNGNRESDSQ